jgi:hypothetical protein
MIGGKLGLARGRNTAETTTIAGYISYSKASHIVPHFYSTIFTGKCTLDNNVMMRHFEIYANVSQ